MKKVIFTLIFTILIINFTSAAFANMGDDIGDVLATDIIAQIDGYNIPSFNVDNSTAIKAADLNNYGFDVVWDGTKREVYIERNKSKEFSPINVVQDNNIITGSKLGDVLYTDIKTFLGGKEVQAFNMNGSTLIYFKELKEYGEISWDAVNRIASLSLEDKKVNFKDKKLEEAIRQHIDKETGDIYVKDIAGIDSLRLNGRDIESLDGLQYFKNLHYLYLNNNKITDITPLKDLMELIHVELNLNNISDVSPLAKLTGLEYLELQSNNISNIEGLGELNNIYHLVLCFNQIVDIRPLSQLINLESLSLQDNKISEIDSLSEMKKLTSLSLINNNIKEISVLRELEGLTGLYLTGNPIFDLEPIFNLKNLESVYIHYSRDLSKAVKVAEKANEIITAIIKHGMTDYEKELAIHDFIIDYAEYDYSYADDSFTPYGLLMNKLGVCQAYAETMEILLTMADIECEVIEGYTLLGAHAWNIVKLDDEYYHVDATFDDATSEFQRYRHFNVSDSEIAYDHSWNKNRYPECEGTLYNYEYLKFWEKYNIPKGTISYIKGKVSLAKGDVAPEGGLAILLTAKAQNKIDWYWSFECYSSICIPAGSNSVEFSIPVIPDEAGYNIYYEFKSNIIDGKIFRSYLEGYITRGVYSEGVTFERTEENKETPVTSFENPINIELIKGKVLKGTINFTKGRKTQSESKNVYIIAYNTQNTSNYGCNTDHKEDTCSFSIDLGTDAQSIILYINVFDGNDYHPMYYSKDGLVEDKDKATVINIKDNITELNFDVDL